MILTDDEIKAIDPDGLAEGFARAIESAVLKKLKAQEPMCWTNDTELSYSQFKRPDGELTSGSFWAEYHEDCDTPLYTNPLPPADVVRDDPRIAELEAVLLECRAVMDRENRIIPGVRFTEAIAKIDEVLHRDP